jgi:hypothetical protein
MSGNRIADKCGAGDGENQPGWEQALYDEIRAELNLRLRPRFHRSRNRSTAVR